MTTQNLETQTSLNAVNVSPTWKIKLLYDGECPLCVREVNFLRKKDNGRGLVAFVDIADENYSAEDNNGIDFETAMGRIHAILADGTIITNLEVFWRVYDILGMGWIYAPTRWPVVGSVMNIIYEIWADWRLALTGRPNLTTIIKDRQQRLKSKKAEDCRCQE